VISDILSLALRARKRVQIRSRRICRGAAHDARTNTRHSALETLRSGAQGGLPGMFFDEVKRSEVSHEEKNRPRSPPLGLSVNEDKKTASRGNRLAVSFAGAAGEQHAGGTAARLYGVGNRVARSCH